MPSNRQHQSTPLTRLLKTGHIPALLLSLCVVGLAVRYGAFVAGGSDAYGYVSQAELWEKGNLRVAQPLAAVFPWPEALWTLTPLGYTPAIDGSTTVVPTYSPGLPLLMAAARKTFGPGARFWVVPVLAGLAVWLTFVLGRHLTGTVSEGLCAALVLGGCVPFLSAAMMPMSDVPATAMWTLSIALAMRCSRRAHLGSGLAAAIAVLIRPNLVVAVPILGAAVLWQSLRAHGRALAALASPFLLACGLLPGPITVALINSSLYGSPLSSGYGPLDQLYSWGYAAVNLRHYGSWMIETLCAYALLGFAAAWLWWPRAARAPVRDGPIRLLIAGFTLSIAVSYLFYLPFSNWQYLRFLLPMFPVSVALGAAVVGDTCRRVSPRHGSAVAVALAIVVSLSGFYAASRLHVFETGKGAENFRIAGNYVARNTRPGGVIFCMQQSGSLRYYARRVTIRYDILAPGWLDPAVDALLKMGMHPYIALEDWEYPEFVRRFRRANRLGALDWPPLASLPGVRFWDAAPAWFIERPRAEARR